MDPGEYEVCTYCGRSIFSDVTECPYCRQYTDGKGPHGLQGEERKLPRVYVLAGWLVLACLLLPFLFAVYRWLFAR